MNDRNLTREEIKAVKRGTAYKAWNRSRQIIILIFFIWGIGGIGLVHINRVTSAIYTIGLGICLVVLFYSVVVASWKCPACKRKLPSKSVSGGTASVCMPILVKECPYCGADLTQRKSNIK